MEELTNILRQDLLARLPIALSAAQLANFCQRWQVQELALFGSVLRDDFRADSDIDLLVTFAPGARRGLLTLAQMKHELEDTLERPVDLVSKGSIEASSNWIRRKNILESAQVIYESR